MQQHNRKKTPKETIVISKVKTSFSTWKLFLLAAMIAIVSFVCFSPVMNNGFVNQDDNVYIFENTNFDRSFPDAVKYFFEAHYFSGNYIPITMLVYAAEHHSWGVKPEYYHTVSLLLHAVNVMLVFAFIYLLSRRKVLVAALVALFFGIHPMHVESVAWAAELKDMLYSLFFIAGLITYYKYLEGKVPELATVDGKNAPERGQKRWIKKVTPMLALCFCCFVFSVLSKPAAIIFPLVLLSLDFYTGRKFDRRVWVEKLPFFVIAFAFGVVAIKAQQADELLRDTYPFYEQIFFASYALVVYIAKLFLPFNLSNYYPYPVTEGGHLSLLVYLAPVAIFTLLFFVFKTLNRSRIVAFGLLFYLLNILLVLQFVSVGAAVMADRYTYIPYIGLLFILAMGIDQLYYNASPKLKGYKYAVVVIVIVFATGFAYLGYARCSVWENGETLATNALEQFPEDGILLNNKGFLLLAKGKNEESRSFFTRAIQNKHDYTMPYINLLNSYLSVGDYYSGNSVIDSALKYCPEDYNIIAAKGYVLGTQHKYPEAIVFYQRSIKIKNDNADAYISMASCYYEMHDTVNWIKALDTGLKYVPENYVLLNNKGYALYLKGDYSEAIKFLKASLDKKPDFQTASINLRDCYRAMNDSAGHNK